MLDAQTKVKNSQILNYSYNKSGSDQKTIKSFTDDEVFELAVILRRGVPMATPVFDGAAENEIKDHVELADLSDKWPVDIV